MSKRGQIALYIMGGIIFILTIFLILSLLKPSLPKHMPISQVKPFVERCLYSVSQEGLELMALQGGYYDVPEGIFFLLKQTPYYYLDGKKILPKNAMIEREISKYVSARIFDCFNNFSSMPDSKVTVGNVAIKATLSDRMVIIDAIIPINERIDFTLHEFSSFRTVVNSNFGAMHSLSQKVVDSYTIKPGFICLTCIEKLSEEFFIKIYPHYDPSGTGVDIYWVLIEKDNEVFRFVMEIPDEKN